MINIILILSNITLLYSDWTRTQNEQYKLRHVRTYPKIKMLYDNKTESL